MRLQQADAPTDADASGSTVTAIDCHAHVMLVDRPLSPLRHSAPARDIPVEEYIGVLDRHGISHGLLTQPSFYGTDNSLLLEALAAFPRRLRGTAIVEPSIDEAALGALRNQGICGVRLNWLKRPELPDAGDGDYQRLFGRLRELDMHVELFLEGPLLPSVLPKIRKSRAHIVLDHFGSPDPEGGIKGEGFVAVLDAVESGDAWVKLSAPYRLGGADPQPYVDALLSAGGPEHLVWATDWPFVGHEDEISYQQCIDWLVQWVPDDKVRRAILTSTPKALFRF